MKESMAYQIMTLRNDFVNFCHVRLQEIHITQGQLFFLLYVGKHEGCTPSVLATGLHMDGGYVTRMIAKLIEQELLIQTVHVQDKRSRILHLTKQGRNAFDFAHNLFHEWDKHITKDLDEQQKADIMTYLKQCRKQIGGAFDENSNCL